MWDIWIARIHSIVYRDLVVFWTYIFQGPSPRYLVNFLLFSECLFFWMFSIFNLLYVTYHSFQLLQLANNPNWFIQLNMKMLSFDINSWTSWLKVSIFSFHKKLNITAEWEIAFKFSENISVVNQQVIEVLWS